MPHTKKKGYKHLLVLRFSAMGDVAMIVPVLRALVTQHPNVNVTVVSREAYRPFFDRIPNVSFYEADFNKRHKGFLGLLRLYKELKALHIYAVADLHNVLRSKVISWFFSRRGKKVETLNKARHEQKALISANGKALQPVSPVVVRHAEVFKKLGFPVILNQDALISKPNLSQDLLSIIGNSADILIGIAPFAQHLGKVYPEDLMQEVVNRVAVNDKIKIFLFGGNKDEAKKLKQMAGNHKNVEVIAGGRLTLAQELKLIANLNLMLSMDSANGHMAAMFGVPVITLWGATHPYSGFAPYNQSLSNSLLANREQYPLLPTSVYGNKVVPGYEDAMRTITPQMVIDKMNEVLERKVH